MFTCSICFVEESDGAKFHTTACGHLFHAECLRQWCFSSSGSVRCTQCPICRTGMRQMPDEDAIHQRYRAFALALPRSSPFRPVLLRMLYLTGEDAQYRAMKKLVRYLSEFLDLPTSTGDTIREICVFVSVRWMMSV